MNISQRFVVLDVIMTIITFSVVFGQFLANRISEELLDNPFWFDTFPTVVINGGNAGILAYASWSIRESILTQSNLKPNQTLVNVHVINSIAYTILALAQAVIYVKLKDSYWIDETITNVFNTWMDLFLIYLIFRFTREKQSSFEDRILNREVPSIVFINNQRLIKESCVLGMEHQSDEIAELKI